MRAFVALEIPEPDVLDSIVDFQSGLAKTEADLKLVERPNLHFTVKFLGEISEPQAHEADERLRALKLTSQKVEIRGTGAFPNIDNPNVLWVGLRGGDETKVELIANSVIHSLDGIGERDSRPFRAHITVARVRQRRKNPELASYLRSNAERSFGSSELKELKLKSSALSPRGPTYSDVGVYQLT